MTPADGVFTAKLGGIAGVDIYLKPNTYIPGLAYGEYWIEMNAEAGKQLNPGDYSRKTDGTELSPFSFPEMMVQADFTGAPSLAVPEETAYHFSILQIDYHFLNEAIQYISRFKATFLYDFPEASGEYLDGAIDYNASDGILGNDLNSDPAVTTAVLIQSTQHGTLTLSSDGGFNYTPEAGYFGSDTFTYEAVNPTGSSGPTVVTLNVVQTTPIAANEIYSVAAGSTFRQPCQTRRPNRIMKLSLMAHHWDPPILSRTTI